MKFLGDDMLEVKGLLSSSENKRSPSRMDSEKIVPKHRSMRIAAFTEAPCIWFHDSELLPISAKQRVIRSGHAVVGVDGILSRSYPE
jgi:hypothetical protein